MDDTCRYCTLVKAQCKCPRFKAKQVKAGEWIQPIRHGYTMECCDCGLVHVMNFRIRKGQTQFQAFRKGDD